MFNFFSKSLILLSILIANMSAETGSYNEGDHVEVYVNKVGPYWNPVSF